MIPILLAMAASPQAAAAAPACVADAATRLAPADRERLCERIGAELAALPHGGTIFVRLLTPAPGVVEAHLMRDGRALPPVGIAVSDRGIAATDLEMLVSLVAAASGKAY